LWRTAREERTTTPAVEPLPASIPVEMPQPAPVAATETPSVRRKRKRRPAVAVQSAPVHTPIHTVLGLLKEKDALAAAFQPTDKLPIPFTSLVVNTGAKLVMIDTGTGGQIAPSAGVLRDNLAAAGIDPKEVDTIVISHFHPDHINGIKDKDNALLFPNAEIMVPEPEWTYWMSDANMDAAEPDLKLTFRNQRRIFSDIAAQVTRFEPGKEVAPGVETLAAAGHTPGHTVFAIHSGNESLLVLGDTAQHPAVFARHPDWQAAFDIDGAEAVATRKRIFDRAAADRMLVTGYHFPFPACGHLIKTATGYEHVPVEWQPTL